MTTFEAQKLESELSRLSEAVLQLSSRVRILCGVQPITPSDDHLAMIAEIVAADYRLTLAALLKRDRHTEIAEARHVAMCLMSEVLHGSSIKISQWFAGRDHGSVLHAFKRVANQASVDAKFAQRVEKLKQECISRLSCKTE